MTGRQSRTPSLRPLGLPRALHVRVDAHGDPVAVLRADARADTRGQSGRESRIEAIDERWRLAEAWWREEPQRRTYYRVILEGGRPLTLFRDDVSGAWFEQPYSAPDQSRTDR